MKYLLDTHAFLCFVGNNPKLGATARSLISDADNIRLISFVSLWEIAIKTGLGKLALA